MPMTSPALDGRTLKIHGFAYWVTSSAWSAAFHHAIGRARGGRTTKVHALTDEPTTHAACMTVWQSAG